MSTAVQKSRSEKPALLVKVVFSHFCLLHTTFGPFTITCSLAQKKPRRQDTYFGWISPISSIAVPAAKMDMKAKSIFGAAPREGV